ncbi:MAG TPA: hypothetical protein PKX78_01955 [Candidatus Woesebacteria bacterium]|nr:hypothetical protein [Candidatus Woesebacteria bacterium]
MNIDQLKFRFKIYHLGLLLIVLGIYFRFSGLNWDAGQHLHPDERFLTMVANDMTLPKSWGEYFDPSVSTFNPANINFPFFVYGVFPVTLNKTIAILLNNNNYHDLTIQGRFLSALFDSLNIFILFFFVKNIKKWSKTLNIDGLEWWSAAIYAALVLPIQLSHFFAVDTFVNTFILGSLFFALPNNLNIDKKNTLRILLSAVFFGLALASKISAVYSAPLIIVFLLWVKICTIWQKKIQYVFVVKQFLRGLFFVLFPFFLTTYITLRMTNPYYFENPSFFNPAISKLFIGNINQLKGFNDPLTMFPPGIQWKSKIPILFPLQNIAFFGLGIPISTLVLIGTTIVVLRAGRNRDLFTGAILFWSLAFFIYQGLQFTHSMRYFLAIYPWLAVFAGTALSIMFYKLNKSSDKPSLMIQKPLITLIIISILTWPMAFTAIYRQPHSRVEASNWIYQNILPGSKLLSEHWDDGLPLSSDFGYPGIYQGEQLEVFVPDSQLKMSKIATQLESADYYIISSNRAWQSISDDANNFPLMSEFYNKLFADQIPNYKLVKAFASFPKLCLPFTNYCYEINDQWAEEAFTVYDHPQVFVFKNL